MQSLKIIFLCIPAAILYGIVHDQVTARICVEYFSVFHPPVFHTRSPTLLALGWGVIATWWVGLFLGLILALASRAGSRPKLPVAALIKPIRILLLVMAACAAVSGLTGFLLTRRGVLAPPAWIASRLTPSVHPAFMADWWAHSASYAVGFFGGILLCIVQFRRRATERR